MNDSDTTQEAADAQISVLQSKSRSYCLALTLSLSDTTVSLSKRAIRRANPLISEDEVRFRFVEVHDGVLLAEKFRKYLQERST